MNLADYSPDRLSLLKASLSTLELQGQFLRQPAAPLDFDAVSPGRRRALFHHLLEVMYREHGIGLAAPMVGIGLRVIVVAHEDSVQVMVNPSVLETSGSVSMGEANLCIPGVGAEVSRPSHLTLRWLDPEGRDKEDSFDGPLARTILHEMDLLDGRIFSDLAAPGDLLHTSSDQRAATATAAVFGDASAQSLPPDGSNPLACLTLPPNLIGIPETSLRRSGEDVDQSKFQKGQFRELVQAMFRLQYDQHGVGLAAPQVGLGLRLAVIDDRAAEPLVLLNPQVVDASDATETQAEGCLSIPGWIGNVSRRSEIKVRNHTVTGKPYDLTAEGYRARVIQHEIDHLDGVLYPDHVPIPERLVRHDPQLRASAALEAACAGERAGLEGIAADPAPA